jgi:hypothetical protein
MVVKFRISSLKQDHWYDYAVRFVLGGLATVVAGIVADKAGPSIGGLMLAFPAIFCASATLIERNERKKKQKKGLPGAARGRKAAALDAAGAAWGSAAMLCFAGIVWWLADRGPWLGLGAASVAWLAVAILLWRVRRRVRAA